MPARFTDSATTWVASSKGSTSISVPLNAVAIGVRAVDTITASGMVGVSSDRLLRVGCCARGGTTGSRPLG